MMYTGRWTTMASRSLRAKLFGCGSASRTDLALAFISIKPPLSTSAPRCTLPKFVAGRIPRVLTREDVGRSRKFNFVEPGMVFILPGIVFILFLGIVFILRGDAAGDAAGVLLTVGWLLVCAVCWPCNAHTKAMLAANPARVIIEKEAPELCGRKAREPKLCARVYIRRTPSVTQPITDPVTETVTELTTPKSQYPAFVGTHIRRLRNNRWNGLTRTPITHPLTRPVMRPVTRITSRFIRVDVEKAT